MSPALTSPSMVASSKPCELAGKAAHQRVTQLRSMQALRRFRKTCCLSHGLSARERAAPVKPRLAGLGCSSHSVFLPTAISGRGSERRRRTGGSTLLALDPSLVHWRPPGASPAANRSQHLE
jgi:hypothetical protein